MSYLALREESENEHEYERPQEQRAKGVQSHFTKDNFTSRRTSGHNAYDPESLLTGAELAAGFEYGDLREYPSQACYDAIVSGQVPVDDIPVLAPRVKRSV